MTNNTLGVLILAAGAAVLVSAKVAFGSPTTGRLVKTWRKNPDGTCTFVYDDGSEETGVCSNPPE